MLGRCCCVLDFKNDGVEDFPPVGVVKIGGLGLELRVGVVAAGGGVVEDYGVQVALRGVGGTIGVGERRGAVG